MGKKLHVIPTKNHGDIHAATFQKSLFCSLQILLSLLRKQKGIQRFFEIFGCVDESAVGGNVKPHHHQDSNTRKGSHKIANCTKSL